MFPDYHVTEAAICTRRYETDNSVRILPYIKNNQIKSSKLHKKTRCFVSSSPFDKQPV